MEKLAQLCQDVVQLWDKYHVCLLYTSRCV